MAQFECGNINDVASFHDELNCVFEFPELYGRNMNAWVDCMTDLYEPGTGMTGIHIKDGEVLALEFVGVKPFRENYPEQYACVVECSSFVNRRRIETGQKPNLALVMDD